MSVDPRLYRFPARDRTGWLLGLQGSQCVALGGGVLIAGILLDSHAMAPMVLFPLVVALVFAFARWNGHPAHELLPALIRWQLCRLGRRTTWRARLVRRCNAERAEVLQPDLPPFLAGLALIDTRATFDPGGRSGRVGVVRDSFGPSYTGVLRVRGAAFALADPGEQDRLVELWGEALSSFCVERGPVARVCWTEWAARPGLDAQLRFLDRHDGRKRSAARRSYAQLVEHAGSSSTMHEVLLSVTVEARRLRRHASKTSDADDAAASTLIEELRLLTGRLESAGLAVDPPLSAVEIAEAMRVRFDPSAIDRLAEHSLAEAMGMVSVHNAGPLGIEVDWDHIRVDGTFHRTYWVAEWPRSEVPASWMEPLLLHVGGIRTVAVFCEPVPPTRSHRQIKRDSTRLISDEEQRQRLGIRVGARHRRAQSAVLEREAELVSGHGEMEFAGFVTISAADVERLERSCADYEQAAGQAGMELRSLSGRQDLALACSLPIGRGLAPRMFA